MNLVRLSNELDSSKQKRSIIKDQIAEYKSDSKALEPQIKKQRSAYEKSIAVLKRLKGNILKSKKE